MYTEWSSWRLPCPRDPLPPPTLSSFAFTRRNVQVARVYTPLEIRIQIIKHTSFFQHLYFRIINRLISILELLWTYFSNSDTCCSSRLRENRYSNRYCRPLPSFEILARISPPDSRADGISQDFTSAHKIPTSDIVGIESNSGGI